MPPEPYGPKDDRVRHPPLQTADPQDRKEAPRPQGEVEGQIQEGDHPQGRRHASEWGHLRPDRRHRREPPGDEGQHRRYGMIDPKLRLVQ